jgi:hypothetical protein
MRSRAGFCWAIERARAAQELNVNVPSAKRLQQRVRVLRRDHDERAGADGDLVPLPPVEDTGTSRCATFFKNI